MCPPLNISIEKWSGIATVTAVMLENHITWKETTVLLYLLIWNFTPLYKRAITMQKPWTINLIRSHHPWNIRVQLFIGIKSHICFHSHSLLRKGEWHYFLYFQYKLMVCFYSWRESERKRYKVTSGGMVDAIRIAYASVRYHQILAVNHFYIRCRGHCYLSI